jgi:hypothetical protein
MRGFESRDRHNRNHEENKRLPFPVWLEFGGEQKKVQDT